MIFNASHIDALIQFGDKFRYAKLQFIWFLFSLLAMLIAYLTPLSLIKRLSPYLMGGGMFFARFGLGPGYWLAIYGCQAMVKPG